MIGMAKQFLNNAGERHQGGFTLVEMMAALAILLFGVTAVLGALSFEHQPTSHD